MNSAARSLLIRRLSIAAAKRPCGAVRATSMRFFVAGGSDSITYSGGQATEGQGGFYGSGGARAQLEADGGDPATDASRRQLLAMAADVEKITQVMEEVDRLEEALLDASGGGGAVTPRTMETKNAIKKLMTAPDFIEALNRLEVQGQPKWGLSTKERELIVEARERINES